MKKSIFYAHLKDAARQRGMDFSQILAQARDLGYEGLECDYADVAPDAAGFGRELAKEQFAVSCVCCYMDFHKEVDLEKIKKVVADVVAVGAKKMLAIPGFFTDENPNALEMMVEGLVLLCREAEKAGIAVGLEDYDSTDSPCSTAAGLTYFFDRIPEIKFVLDTGNFLYSGEDVLEVTVPFMNRLVHIHLKDRSLKPLHPAERPLAAVNGLQMYPSPVGSGVIPMEELLTRAKAVGYDDFCTAEHFDSADQWDYVVKSAAWLDRHL